MINSAFTRVRVFRCLMTLAAMSALSACGGLGANSDRGFDQRFYAGAGVLASRLEPDTSEVTGVSVDETNSSGGAFLLGYDLNNRFSIEGHVASLGESTLTPDGSISYQVGGISGLFYGLNDRDDRMLREGFSAFGRFGVGTLENDAEVVNFERVNTVHLLVGAGLEYGFENGLAARAELIAHESDARYAQLALIYRFGDSSYGLEPDSRTTLPETPAVPAAPEAPASDAQLSSVPAPDNVAREPLVVDADQDGVMDDVDACLDTGAGLPVDTTGCEVFDGVVEGITFVSGSADLTDEAISALQNVAQTLIDYPEVSVTIEAHTDSQGDATVNLQLSRRRALAVARFLTAQGIAGSRLRPQAFGESEPRASNATPEGRAANRRVEFTVLQ